VAVLLIALLVSYPWQLMTVIAIVYLACLPFGWFSYRRYQRQDAEALARSAAAAPVVPDQPLTSAPPEDPSDDERPARLN
jgi:CDP-diacylglycerol--serine O-phosphatidyltransferase